MKWLEMITLRASGLCLENLVAQFISPLSENIGKSGLCDIQVYTLTGINTDLSIHIHWDTERVSRQATLIGSCLAQTLEDYGLISHVTYMAQDLHRQSDKEQKNDR